MHRHYPTPTRFKAGVTLVRLRACFPPLAMPQKFYRRIASAAPVQTTFLLTLIKLTQVLPSFFQGDHKGLHSTSNCILCNAATFSEFWKRHTQLITKNRYYVVDMYTPPKKCLGLLLILVYKWLVA